VFHTVFLCVGRATALTRAGSGVIRHRHLHGGESASIGRVQVKVYRAKSECIRLAQ
jgi:hypothetical protein